MELVTFLLLLKVSQIFGQEPTVGIHQMLDKCCNLGQSWANDTKKECDQFQVPVSDVIPELQAPCISTMEVCCSKTRREQQCNSGKSAALNMLECNLKIEEDNKTRSDIYKSCCLSCTLGITVASMDQSCTKLPSGFDCILEKPFSECCQEMLEPQDNLKIVDDNTSIVPPPPPGLTDLATLLQSEETTESGEDSQCPDGYQYNGAQNVCDDMDECVEEIDDCLDDEICFNTIGSYDCDLVEESEQCLPGFRFYLISCIDINECHEDEDICGDDICVNQEGNYTCQSPAEFKDTHDCPPGFRQQNGQCEDINECQTGEHNCLSSQRCDNTLGSFACVRYITCGTGYTLNYETGKCEDNNECALGNHNCDNLGPEYFCRNIQGSFRCERKKCNVGEMLDEDGLCMPLACGTGFEPGLGGNCIDVDECSSPDSCNPGESCANRMGSFECISSCEIGLRLDSRTNRCEDINECTTGLAACFHGASCINTIGSYRCTCSPGFTVGSGGVCQDINECLKNGRPNRFICGIDSNCQNTPGSYRCNCKQGFEHSGRNCVDINECEDIPDICGHSCLNLWGSYKCHCDEGYQLSTDQRTCRDIDECEERNRCVGGCINSPGSYKCSCPPGYRLSSNGRSCQDIDECKEESPCVDTNQYCHNTRGGYKCKDVSCSQGYVKESQYSNRCKRTSRRCRSTDFVCLRKPVSISFNFMSLISNLQVAGTGIDLFTMQSARYEQISTKFTLKIISIQAATGIKPVTKSSFRLKTGIHQATLTLTESVQGPQDIELELLMEMYYQARFTGSATARIYIFVTPYEF